MVHKFTWNIRYQRKGSQKCFMETLYYLRHVMQRCIVYIYSGIYVSLQNIFHRTETHSADDDTSRYFSYMKSCKLVAGRSCGVRNILLKFREWIKCDLLVWFFEINSRDTKTWWIPAQLQQWILRVNPNDMSSRLFIISFIFYACYTE